MPETESVDIAIIGAGAAGLMAGIWAGRECPRRVALHESGLPRRILLLDGARHIGAKILVAGGGRCNVTHDVVDDSAFAGSSRHAIRKVLKRFDVQRTIEYFREIGVELKREDTGKLFPITDDARTVLDALLRAAKHTGDELRHPWRVTKVLTVSSSLPGRTESPPAAFEIIADDGRTIAAQRIILATGGKSLPKTGSDGAGYELARGFGHSITHRVFPALVPLTLPKDHPLCALSGISAIAILEVRKAAGKRLVSFTDSTLCTHFGLSGPGPLDISRYLTDARFDDPAACLVINWLPNETAESFDRALVELSRSKNAISCGRFLRKRDLPARLVETLCAIAGIDPSASGSQLTRDQRRSIVAAVVEMKAPITGDRGFAHAEVTAGGVPLSELRLETMESRIHPGLYIIGEMCDVDGRIGGYNFQWAWASGYVAGTAAANCT